MQRAIVSIIAGFCWIVPAHAGSALVDLSKPMSGKSRYVLNADGTAADLGAPVPTPSPGARSGMAGPGSAAVGGGGNGAVTVMSSSGNGYSAGPRTFEYRGYIRRDGTFVAPYIRTEPYSYR
jgi:hypothetical protein